MLYINLMENAVKNCFNKSELHTFTQPVDFRKPLQGIYNDIASEKEIHQIKFVKQDEETALNDLFGALYY